MARAQRDTPPSPQPREKNLDPIILPVSMSQPQNRHGGQPTPGVRNSVYTRKASRMMEVSGLRDSGGIDLYLLSRAGFGL